MGRSKSGRKKGKTNRATKKKIAIEENPKTKDQPEIPEDETLAHALTCLKLERGKKIEETKQTPKTKKPSTFRD